MCGFCNVWVCVCVGFVMCGCVYVCVFCNVWVCVCVGVLVICVLVFSVFCIVCTVFLYCFVYVHLFSIVTGVRTTATE